MPPSSTSTGPTRAGNGQILSPDPFFDALFLGAAERRFLTTERVVENGELADGDHPLSSVPIHRILVDGVAETPGGAHFTANPPDYGRDENFQKEYAAAATDPAEWEAFATRYVFVDDDEYRAARGGARSRVSDPGVTRAESCVIACAEVWREAGEVMVSPFGTIPALGARLAKLTFCARHRAHRRRGGADGGCASAQHPARPSWSARRPCRTAPSSTSCGRAGAT